MCSTNDSGFVFTDANDFYQMLSLFGGKVNNKFFVHIPSICLPHIFNKLRY